MTVTPKNGSQTVMIRIHATAPLPAVISQRTATAQAVRQPISKKQYAKPVMQNTANC